MREIKRQQASIIILRIRQTCIDWCRAPSMCLDDVIDGKDALEEVLTKAEGPFFARMP